MKEITQPFIVTVCLHIAEKLQQTLVVTNHTQEIMGKHLVQTHELTLVKDNLRLISNEQWSILWTTLPH